MSRHNVTVQFPDRPSYDKLTQLARACELPLGTLIAKLVAKDIKKRGISWSGNGSKKDGC